MKIYNTSGDLLAEIPGDTLRGADLRGADLEDANLEDADLENADLKHANLKHANLDFCAFPLFCGSTQMVVYDRYIAQLAYHLTRVDYSNCSPEVVAAVKAVEESVLGNLFLKFRDDLTPIGAKSNDNQS